jgi:hypothetical protein
VGGRGPLGGTKYPERPLRAGAVVARSLCLRPPAGRAPPPLRQPGRQVIWGSRGHVDRAGAPELAMAAAVSGVVRRVEELGDLAQAHIQHLSEAAGEDGEGAPQREVGGRW